LEIKSILHYAFPILFFCTVSAIYYASDKSPFGSIASISGVFTNKATIPAPSIATESKEPTLSPEQIHLQKNYHLDASAHYIQTGEIQKNQFLSDILGKYNVENARVHELATKAKDVFSVTKLGVNKPYTVLIDTINYQAEVFIYHANKIDFVIYDLRNEMQVYKGKREHERKTLEAAGIIDGSLYGTMVNNAFNPALAAELSEIFAWSVDFFKVQRGDKFKLIYDEYFIDDESVLLGDVKAAYFESNGVRYYAFAYEQDGKTSYYDENGNSLRKAFLRAPLKYSRISSRFTRKRYHPVLKRYKAHLGTDYAASRGTPIMSVGDGTVIAAAYNRANGRYVKIKHNGTYTTQYLHMSKFAKGMKKGKRVKQGDVIGYVGSTGLATGPHLCYRFWKNGKQVDPLKEIIQHADPIDADLRDDYMTHKATLLEHLNIIEYPSLLEQDVNLVSIP